MSRWMIYAFATVLLNGAVLTTQKCVSAYYPRTDYTQHFLALAFLISAAICWAFLVGRRRKPRLADAALGAASGVISYVGNVAFMQCLAGAHASLVFPLVLGATTVLVTLYSWAVFKEELTPRTICAMLAGVASIIVLKLS